MRVHFKHETFWIVEDAENKEAPLDHAYESSLHARRKELLTRCYWNHVLLAGASVLHGELNK